MPGEAQGEAEVDIPAPVTTRYFSFWRQHGFQHFTQSCPRFCEFLLVQGFA
jgi:hypothetical protein